jgi:site-specific recombinase XerD
MFQDTTKTAQRPSDTFSKITEKDGLSIPDLREQAELYIAIYCYAQSPKTIRGKRDVLAYLIGFLERTKARTCNPLAMARFFRHCINGHTEPEGRFGRGATCGNSKPYKPLRPRSLQLYHIYLKTFFDKLVEEGIIPKSPMHGMKRPKALEEEIYPFTENHIDGLLTAADKSKAPLRNRALLLLMWDTGIRLTELCSLYQGDLDLKTSTVVIRKGKNSKMRICVFSNETALALLRYKRSLSALKLEEDDHLFLTFAQGSKTPLQPNGVYQLYKRTFLATR